MLRLLIVEDNPEYRKGASEFFGSFGSIGISPVYAVDYESAVENLYVLRTDLAMIDCFFPSRTGSGDISLGREIVERMAQSDPTEIQIREGLKSLEPYVDLSDLDMRKYARAFIGTSEHRDISSVLRAIERVNRTAGKAAAAHIAKNTFGMTYRESRAPKDYYRALMEAMEQSEANQPLGIEVAERATELRIPLVLVTSTHHHDILTQPVQNYAGRKGWPLVDCSQDRANEKATPEFWQRAYDALKGAGARF